MNETNHLEIEVKLGVIDLDDIARRLEAAGATLTAARVYERNVRYESAADDLSERGIVLRMRQDTRARLTYKEPVEQINGGMNTRFEAEVVVDDFDTMTLILGRLGFIPYMVYEKYRTTYTLDDVEIVLDELPYGTFIEIEGAPDAINRMIDKLNLTSARRYIQNYIGLFANIRARRGLTFTDLTFDNFDGLDITPADFEPLT